MPLLLNIETATPICSVALAKDGQLLSLRETDIDRSHSSHLTMFAEAVLTETGLTFQDLDGIAVSKGPGSYTGLRIGVASAKGLCYALDKPLLAVDTLQSIATGARQKMPMDNAIYCPMIDARRMEVYYGWYDGTGACLSDPKPQVIAPGAFRETLDQQPMIFCGNGTPKCKHLLQHPNAYFLEGVICSAAYMIPLSEKAYTSKAFEDRAYFKPVYLKEIPFKKKKDLL